MGLFDGGIRSTVANAFRGRLLTGTLRRPVVTSRDAYGDQVFGTPVEYTFDGIDLMYDSMFRAESGIPMDHIQILVIAGSLDTTPTRDDLVQIRGEWYQIHAIRKDPANATWDLESSLVGDPDG